MRRVAVSRAYRVLRISLGFARSARRRFLVRNRSATNNGCVGWPKMRKLSSQIFAAQLAILTATVLTGFVLFARVERHQLDHQYEERSAAIAQTVAGAPDVGACLENNTALCTQPVQTVASRIQNETGAAYVV